MDISTFYISLQIYLSLSALRSKKNLKKYFGFFSYREPLPLLYLYHADIFQILDIVLVTSMWLAGEWQVNPWYCSDLRGLKFIITYPMSESKKRFSSALNNFLPENVLVYLLYDLIFQFASRPVHIAFLSQFIVKLVQSSITSSYSWISFYSSNDHNFFPISCFLVSFDFTI